jgi:glycerol-3-phosphate O-acyltransferase/dihydroxyacetone phosphate acyltransferase
MALGAMSDYNTENVKIVPVGLNYFNRHRFRSEVIIEFGKAFEVPRSWADEFKINKKEATEKLLNEIESVTYVIDHRK